MSGIRKPEIGQVTFDEKLEYVRGMVMMLADTDEEAKNITQTLSIQMGIESSNPDDIDAWCDEYGSSSREMAIRYHKDVMPGYHDDRKDR